MIRLTFVLLLAGAIVACSDDKPSTRSQSVQMPTMAEIEKAIESSDDFSKHRDVFLRAAATLIQSGTCSLEQLREYGGWVKSTQHKSEPVYFTYCGASNTSSRIYLNVATGETFR
jgi:hypothetical protein